MSLLCHERALLTRQHPCAQTQPGKGQAVPGELRVCFVAPAGEADRLHPPAAAVQAERAPERPHGRAQQLPPLQRLAGHRQRQEGGGAGKDGPLTEPSCPLGAFPAACWL